MILETKKMLAYYLFRDILYMDDSTDDEDWFRESSGDDSAQRKRLRSSASLLTLSISLSFLLFLSF